MFALVDCNSFYASCERVFRPDLRDKPIVVLSNNDGCVIARTDEAKALNIPMGAPAFEYKELFKKHNIHVFSSNYALYADMSRRVMNILQQFTPDVEIYSIDEAFLQFKGFENYDLQTYCIDIKCTVEKWTGIPVCIGVGPSKALAKVANKIAKKYKSKTKGVHIIDTEELRVKALKWTSIEDVWGIGRQHSRRLLAKGIDNAYKFTLNLTDDWVRKHMTVVGLRLKHDLEGRPTIQLEGTSTKKGIATTRSFKSNIKDYRHLTERVSTFADSCAEKLRSQNSHCNSMYVFINTNPHREDLNQYRRGMKVRLPYPSNSSITLSYFALFLLKHIYKSGYEYKKAGVVVGDITPAENYQIDLFNNENPKHKPLMQTMDYLTDKYGYPVTQIASRGKKRWKLRQQKLSPKYTTNFKDIITVK